MVTALFSSRQYTCVKGVTNVKVTVRVDRGGVQTPCTVLVSRRWQFLRRDHHHITISAYQVEYYTADGSAKQASDYSAQQGTLIFNPDEIEKSIFIELVNNNVYEEDNVCIAIIFCKARVV